MNESITRGGRSTGVELLQYKFPTHGRLSTVLLAVVLLLLGASTGRAQIIKNGSFELPVVQQNSFTRSVTPTNWTWSGTTGFIFNGDAGSFWPLARNGAQFADLGFYPGTTLSQVFSISSAGDYRLAWYETGGNIGESAYVTSIKDASGRTIASVTRNAYHFGTTRFVWGRAELPVRLTPGQFSLVFTAGTGVGSTDRLIDEVVLEGPAIAIVSEPADQVVPAGDPASLSVVVTGGSPIGYQWLFNGVPINGATNAVFLIAKFSDETVGDYAVRITNPLGSTNSRLAKLTTPELPHRAKATATVVNGFVVGAVVTDPGLGYTNTPSVRFIGGGGAGAAAVATMVDSRVTGITILNPGSGYTNAPIVAIAPLFVPQPNLGIAAAAIVASSNLLVGQRYQLERFDGAQLLPLGSPFLAESGTFSKRVAGSVSPGSYRLTVVPRPVQAVATAQVINGFVVGVVVTEGGAGYTEVPEVHFRGGGGSNATATATIDGGKVTGIRIGNPGIGYASMPTVVVDLPPSASLPLEPVSRWMDVSLTDLAPYEGYQLESVQDWSEGWRELGVPITPDKTNVSVSIEVNRDAGFYQVRHLPASP